MTIAYEIYDCAATDFHIPDCVNCGETDCPDCGTISLLPPPISLSDAICAANTLAIQAGQLAKHCRDHSAGMGIRNHRAGNLTEATAVSLRQAAGYLNRVLEAADEGC